MIMVICIYKKVTLQIMAKSIQQNHNLRMSVESHKNSSNMDIFL